MDNQAVNVSGEEAECQILDPIVEARAGSDGVGREGGEHPSGAAEFEEEEEELQ